MDVGVSLADSILCGRVVLEPRGRRDLRIPDQSPDCAVLHAGVEYDSGTCALRPVWSLWAAVSWIDAARCAKTVRSPCMEGKPARGGVLGDEHWAGTHDCAQPAAHRNCSDLGECRDGIVVRAQRGLPPAALDRIVALDENGG